jgi:hypothetical protein
LARFARFRDRPFRLETSNMRLSSIHRAGAARKTTPLIGRCRRGATRQNPKFIDSVMRRGSPELVGLPKNGDVSTPL